MNEITRIHIAKTAYDIEVAAKKKLEKYIKDLEVYTQDKEVLEDIEIRMTELLNDRGVKPGGVVSADDIEAIKTQLGQPYEFADEEGDIAVGTVTSAAPMTHRLYRSTDDALLGGVLSGIATYLNVNSLWLRLIFIVLLFASFGFATILYIAAWILIPPARTATEKLQLSGKNITLQSIRELNENEEASTPNRVAPMVQRVVTLVLGAVSLLGAIITAIFTVTIAVAAFTSNETFLNITNGFTGLGEGSQWIVWMLFGVVIFGLTLLAALFSLIAYAFFTRKLTKRIVVTAVIITALGITSVAAVISVSATQSWRVANESRSMVIETKSNLPQDFNDITSLIISQNDSHNTESNETYFGQQAVIRYIVDSGPARYELSALPTAKAKITSNNRQGEISLEIPHSYRNSFVQPILTIYGPSIQTITSDLQIDYANTQVSYEGMGQKALIIDARSDSSNLAVSGQYEEVVVTGKGSVNLDSSSIRGLTVNSAQGQNVQAGTVNRLTITQPDVCPNGSWSDATSVAVVEVTSGQIEYNGKAQPAYSLETSCAQVRIGADDY